LLRKRGYRVLELSYNNHLDRKREEPYREILNALPGREKPLLSLSWGQALAYRLSKHHLDRRARKEDLTRVVADICGVHAQLFAFSKGSQLLRIQGKDTGRYSHATLCAHALALDNLDEELLPVGGRDISPAPLSQSVSPCIIFNE